MSNRGELLTNSPEDEDAGVRAQAETSDDGELIAHCRAPAPVSGVAGLYWDRCSGIAGGCTDYAEHQDAAWAGSEDGPDERRRGGGGPG